MVQLVLAFALLLARSVADAATANYKFTVGSMKISQLCSSTDIIAVNGQLPGPAIEVNEGDAVVVNVINASPYNLTIHWHGVLQLMTPWADGPDMVTQCPIQPNSSYTYRFNVPGQEGTLWWHAHSSSLSATVHGAFIVRPRRGNTYPFPAPDKEVPIVLGEWWNRNVVDVESDAILAGQLPTESDAFTVNGKTGQLYQCANETFTVDVEPNTRVLLRVINAGLNAHLFFKLAGHNFTVVAVDAGYTSNLNTDTLVIAPGQTVDALVSTNAAPGSYYMAVQEHNTLTPSTMAASDTTTATAILRYNGTSVNPPAMPTMPASSDSATANAFYFGLRGLATPGAPAVPSKVDVSMTIELALGQLPCDPSQTKCNGSAAAAAMNGVSFRLPAPQTSLLGAYVNGMSGVYTADFPDGPPPSGTPMAVGTKVKKLKYNSVVEIVLQNPAAVPTENHPIHLHGFNFFVLAQGIGNFTPGVSYNLVDPVARNTIAVPGGGWAVIRFVANNPGMWFFHCHLDQHVPMGLGMVFEVESGTTPGSTLPPLPADWVGVCDAQHYAAAVEAPAPAEAPRAVEAPAPAEAPRAVDHKPSPTLPQGREHTSLPSNSAAGPEAVGHFTCFFCLILLLFVLHEQKV
ncbi:laccase-7-like [Phragmites australis]|uniref:laccase-7-like n=1 Tax=Phragmites australis TaxID=29695 RepID=UPI002D78C522|nr:laccase-7-like [Phragmites australis]